jgi:hypothetical protein
MNIAKFAFIVYRKMKKKRRLSALEFSNCIQYKELRFLTGWTPLVKSASIGSSFGLSRYENRRQARRRNSLRFYAIVADDPKSQTLFLRLKELKNLGELLNEKSF